MELKEFIKETISGIIEATSELQFAYENEGVIINPPVSVRDRDLYKDGDSSHTLRRVQLVEFDVAVTVAKETTAGGKAGLRIFSAEASASGSHNRTNEEVSRVKFSIPLTLSASSAERRNRETLEVERARREHAQSEQRKKPGYLRNDGW